MTEKNTPPNFAKCLFTYSEENVITAKKILRAAGYKDNLKVSPHYRRAIAEADHMTLRDIVSAIPGAAIA